MHRTLTYSLNHLLTLCQGMSVFSLALFVSDVVIGALKGLSCCEGMSNSCVPMATLKEAFCLALKTICTCMYMCDIMKINYTKYTNHNDDIETITQ